MQACSLHRGDRVVALGLTVMATASLVKCAHRNADGFYIRLTDAGEGDVEQIHYRVAGQDYVDIWPDIGLAGGRTEPLLDAAVVQTGTTSVWVVAVGAVVTHAGCTGRRSRGRCRTRLGVCGCSQSYAQNQRASCQKRELDHDALASCQIRACCSYQSYG